MPTHCTKTISPISITCSSLKSIVQYGVVGGKKFIEVIWNKIELSLVELTTLKLDEFNFGYNFQTRLV
jgi:hypothetical protein